MNKRIWQTTKLLELKVEMEVRELLDATTSPATTTPVIIGSALERLEER
ncbi:hypothetical protein [endosymbiont of Lamellibrachia barhami]|nr:hypothetical protein [endosymbiont of Lamellibrachia barhami]